MAKTVRVKVSIIGTRTMLQHHFGPDAIPLEKGERSGVAGNDPEEWRKTCMVSEDGRLYIPGTYFFSCLKNGAIHTKKGRGSLQPALVSTLQIEEDVVYLNRKMPAEEDLTKQYVLTPADPSILTFIYVASVRNPATKGRNVRYRIGTRSGWKCSFTMTWDKTIVSREQMRAILHDSGTLGGLGDGIKIGCGRFEVVKFEEIDDAENKTASRSVDDHSENSMGERRKKMRSM